jgi:hypothetical protein
MTHVYTGVRILAEGTEEIIGYLPRTAEHLSEGNEIVYGLVDGPTVTYKVEKVRYVSEYKVVSYETGHDSYSVYGQTDYIVSVVP